MTKLTDWIKRHQVAAFYIVTFAITCGLGFSYGAVLKRGQYLLAPLAFIAACGPALAGIIISGVDRPFHRCGGAGCLCDQRGLLAHPSSEKLPLLVDPAARRVGLVFPGTGVDAGFGPAFSPHSQPPSQATHHSSPVPGCKPGADWLGVVKFLYKLFFFNATGEDAGWRGFAMPRLQARFSPLIGYLGPGFVLGALALLLLAGGRKASLDPAILDRNVHRPHPFFFVDCMDL